MSLPVRFSIQAGETYDAIITQINMRWGKRFVDEFEQKVAKATILISNSNVVPFSRLRNGCPQMRSA
jgi:hypothetical protein